MPNFIACTDYPVQFSYSATIDVYSCDNNSSIVLSNITFEQIPPSYNYAVECNHLPALINGNNLCILEQSTIHEIITSQTESYDPFLIIQASMCILFAIGFIAGQQR